MSKRGKLLISALLFAVTTSAAAWFFLRRDKPPLPIRILPEGDLLLYSDLRPLHLLSLKQSKPLQLEGDYQQFVDQTGIQFERDLDEVAMSRRDTADAHDVESSEVFIGRFDRSRLDSYLHRATAQTEDYHSQTIYSIPNQNHTVRVCLLDRSTVAVTNMDSSQPMHDIIDGWQHPPRGPSLLNGYYRRVPLGSLAWMIDRVPSNAPQLPGGLSFGFLENTVAVASVRYAGSLRLRADVVAQTETDARRIMESANASLLMYRSLARSLGARGSDPDVKAAVDSIEVQQEGKVAVFSAVLSERFLRKVWSEAQPELPSAAPPSRTQPESRKR